MSLLSRLAVQAARAYGILSSNKNNLSASYLVVAGGAGGGGGYGTGGGGAGGYLTSTATLSTLNTYSITVGAGGGGGAGGGASGTNGSDSILSGTGLTTITSTGGGGGGRLLNGSNGGSGGGGGGKDTGSATSGGTATSGQGNNGGAGGLGFYYSGGGGGGASAVGSNGAGAGGNTPPGGNGGNGSASSISGSSVTYAGGGGGSAWDSVATRGNGGTGGGGNGGGSGSNTGTAGTANTGGGGGGSGGATAGAAGGSGIVIISYTSATPKFVGGTLTTSGGNQIHTFTSSGTLSPITPVTASYLVVAGGGSGGTDIGGGGGAGGLLTSSTTLYSGATYVVTVGAGGAKTATGNNFRGNNGSDSSLSGTGLTTLTVTGGGGGGCTSSASPTFEGKTGGSGGGGGRNLGGGTAPGGAGNTPSTSPSQGNNGGTSFASASAAGSGGGGSSAVGTGSSSTTVGAVGGAGTASSISGSSLSYAGGGGGFGSTTGGAGGTGGGGAGGSNAGGIDGTTNTGGGGGGGNSASAGGQGGSGTVIISYAGSQVFNGGLVTSSGGNTIHTFNATGALTPLTNNLTNSLRFRQSASAYLNRTPSVAGNRRTWTWSAWVKRGSLGARQTVFAASLDGNNENWLSFQSDDTLNLYNYESSIQYTITSSQVFRDPSAWYHIVVAFDTPQATAANRIKIYINGSQVTAFSTATYPSQNFDGRINNTVAHALGRSSSAFPNYFDGYMDDINFIDGQALEPYYFGNNDANGVWKPIKYTGMYGTNGFYLTFADTTSTTTLGYDSSGNNNNWTTNNISLTAGTTYDAMLDVPTNTSATVANYCVINPLQIGAYVTASNGNLTLTGNTSTNSAVAIATISFASGKYYYEYTQGTVNTETCGFALVPITGSLIDAEIFAANNAFGARAAGTTYGTAKIASSLTSWTSGDVVGIAIDADNGAAYWSKNGVWQTSGVPTSGASKTGAVAGWTPTASSIVTPFFGAYNGGFINANFGQRPFSYTPPTGFVRLNTFNLPTPTILQGNKYMDATLYTGNLAATQVIVNQGQFKPDLVWGQARSAAYGSWLFDSVRGATKQIASFSANAESTQSTMLTAFNNNGFNMGSDTAGNNSGVTFVGWQWQAGQGSTSSNTSGSITSTVSVNTTAGFSVVTWTGTAANGTIGHGLGVAPKMIICKSRGDAASWGVWHTSLTSYTYYLNLNLTNAQATAGTTLQAAPSATLVSLGSSNIFNSGQPMVMYAWAEIAGFSKFGSYTGNGSTDGTFVYTGFRPKFIMIKRTDAIGDWYMIDTSRATYNVVNPYLLANKTNIEATDLSWDTLSNGFKLRSSYSEINGSGNTMIYMAFAENPFKNANAR